MTLFDPKLHDGSARDGATETPQAFGRYKVIETIGTGSMGTVYAAQDVLIGRKVAIKCVRSDFADAQQADDVRERFRQEVRSAARCAHHGIVGILDFIDRDDEQYIVMEHVAGPSLQHILSRGPLAQPEALEIASQLLAALEHAHAHGVVHRDIKPANILLGEGSKVKLADFGVAWTSVCEPSGAIAIFGTPSYMSPEQARGGQVDVRSDLFSAGMVLLRMLTGAPAYADASFTSVLRQLASPEAIVVAGLEPSMDAVVRLAIAKEPSHRFQSAGAFVRALRELQAAGETIVDLDALCAQRTADDEGAFLPDEPTLTAVVAASTALAAPDVNETVFMPRSSSGGEAKCRPSHQMMLLQPRIIEVLKDHVGPIAELLSHRLAPGCETPESLVYALSLAIEHDATRGRFVTAVRAFVDLDAVPKPSGPNAKGRRRRLGWRLSNAGAH